METQLAILILQSLLQYGPAFAREITALFSKETITTADWDKVFSMAEKNYADYVKK